MSDGDVSRVRARMLAAMTEYVEVLSVVERNARPGYREFWQIDIRLWTSRMGEVDRTCKGLRSWLNGGGGFLM